MPDTLGLEYCMKLGILSIYVKDGWGPGVGWREDEDTTREHAQRHVVRIQNGFRLS